MNYFKRIVIALLALIILIGLAVFILVTFYKKEMASVLTEKLKESYNLTLKTDEIKVSFFNNFPHVSVDLKNIYLANDVFENKSAPLLKAGSLSLSFNVRKLFQKQFVVKSIAIKDAEILLLREVDGSRNFEIKAVKKDTSVSNNFSFEVSQIHIKKTKFDFINLERDQKISFQLLDNTIKPKKFENVVCLDVSGKTMINQLLFNPQKGAFLKNTRTNLSLKVDYFKDTKSICIRPSSFVEIQKQQYQIASLIDLGDEKRMALYIASEKIWCEKVARLLPPKLQKTLANFDVKTPIAANILVVSNIGKREEPAIIVNIASENTDLTIGNNSKVPYSHIKFRGKIISLDSTRTHGDSKHAQLIFSPVSGKLYDFPFSAIVRVNDFTDPQLDVHANLFIEGKKIETKKDLNLNGLCTAVFQYSGACNKLNKNEFLSDEMKLNANLNFKNFSYQLPNTHFIFTLNGDANVNNKDLKFENLLLNTNGGNVTLKGKAYNFVNYALGFNDGFKAELAAYTDNFTINPYMEKNKKATTTKSQSKSSNALKNQNKFEFVVSLVAKKLLVRKVQATNANIKFVFKSNVINLKSVNVNACDGKISGNGIFQNFNKLNADISIQNVNVTKLFEQFEDFGQDAITSKNLKGNISIDAKLNNLELDNNMEVIGESMNSDVKLKLKDGHLINYEPLQNISRFVFRNRNFEDVTFSELNENFKVRGYKMQIEELEIASNVLNLFVVGGIYDFKGETNLNLLIPWNNLKRRNKDYVPQASGKNAEDSRGMKINVSGENKKMKLSFGHKGFEALE